MEEQIPALRRLFAEGPRRAGHFVMVVEMLETTNFFEEQITECKSAATHATNKNDQEFWLKMAHRWEGLLQARQARRKKPPLW
jgi:hypothetical protein